MKKKMLTPKLFLLLAFPPCSSVAKPTSASRSGGSVTRWMTAGTAPTSPPSAVSARCLCGQLSHGSKWKTYKISLATRFLWILLCAVLFYVAWSLESYKENHTYFSSFKSLLHPGYVVAKDFNFEAVHKYKILTGLFGFFSLCNKNVGF